MGLEYGVWLEGGVAVPVLVRWWVAMVREGWGRGVLGGEYLEGLFAGVWQGVGWDGMFGVLVGWGSCIGRYVVYVWRALPCFMGGVGSVSWLV